MRLSALITAYIVSMCYLQCLTGLILSFLRGQLAPLLCAMLLIRLSSDFPHCRVKRGRTGYRTYFLLIETGETRAMTGSLSSYFA